jgi:iron complex outermembrane receptor protein
MKSKSILLTMLAASTSVPALAQPVNAPPPANVQIEQAAPAVPAADAATPSATVDDASGVATPPSTDAEGGIEDIVVTATRREERLQRIPVAVTAVTGEKLAASGVVSTQTLTQVVPGLLFSRSGSGGQPVIRGVGPSGASSNGDEPSVATYIDGVYQPDAYATLMELVEVQRVEVLRGPQGTVFGRNATGGLINIITPDPSFNFRGRVAGTYGRLRNDAGDIDVRAYMTGPVSSTIAADFAFLYKNRDGFIKDLVRGGTLGKKEAIDTRAKIMWQPSDSAKIIFTAQTTDYHSQENVYQPLDDNTRGKPFRGVILPDGPWQGSVDWIPRNDYNRHLMSLRTSFDLGFVNLETTSGYTYSKVKQQADSDSTNIRLAVAGPMPFKTESYSQEVRLLSQSGGSFNWLAGAYAFHLDSSGVIPTLAATVTNGVPGPLGGPILRPDVNTTSYAVFAEGTYQIAEPLFFTGGARWTYEKRDFIMLRDNNVVLIPKDKFNMDKVTYRFAVRYQPTPDWNVYASYGTGFKSGAYNTITRTLNRVDPETIKSLEGGIKADITRNLRVNLALFHYKFDNLQVSARHPVNVEYILQNAATSKSYGGELEVTAVPFEGLSVTGTASYAHARYESFPLAQGFVPRATGGNDAVTVDASGNHMVKAPMTTFSISPRYEHDFGSGTFDISANLFHSAKWYADFGNRFHQPAYTTLSAQVGYTVGQLRFTVSGTNITDEVVYDQLRVGSQATDVILAAPREVKFGVEVKF